MKYDVFISYSRKDTATADRICAAFDRAGISYFIDRQGIAGGMEFPQVLADAIEESTLFLFLASENSYQSKFTNNEVLYAFNEKPSNSLLPYVIDGSRLPKSLRFSFASINVRNIEEHPVEPVLVDDVLRLLGREAEISTSCRVAQDVQVEYPVTKRITQSEQEEGYKLVGKGKTKLCWEDIPKNVQKAQIADTVEEIETGAFFGVGIVTSVIIPNSVKKIGESAFNGCDLKEIDIPDSVKEIGKYAFYKCRQLKRLTIPNSVTTIGQYAFAYCSELEEAVVSKSVNTIKAATFHGCENLKKVRLLNPRTQYKKNKDIFGWASFSDKTEIIKG